MDQQPQVSMEEFQAKCQEFSQRLAAQINQTNDQLGVVVNGSLHFAGFLLAQYINSKAYNRPVDLQEEVSVAAGVLANAAASFLNQMHGANYNNLAAVTAANDPQTLGDQHGNDV